MHGNLVAAPAAAAKDNAAASGGFTGSARIPQFRFCDACHNVCPQCHHLSVVGTEIFGFALSAARPAGGTVARLPKAIEPVAFASAAAASSDSSLIPPRPSSPSWPASAAAAPVESDVRPARLPSAGHLASITTLSCFPSPWPAIPKAAPDPCQPTGHALLRELHAPPSATPQSREQPS